MGNLSSIGKIDIFADTGLDQWEIVKSRVLEEVERKKLKDGDRRVMRVAFDESLMVEINVYKLSEEAK